MKLYKLNLSEDMYGKDFKHELYETLNLETLIFSFYISGSKIEYYLYYNKSIRFLMIYTYI